MIKFPDPGRKNIDLSLLGLLPSDGFVPYYCTPKNARIIGVSGADGIHYCTIKKFGDTVFAVSPMNFGDCVHPIAWNFEDLLRLLLACGDIGILEQIYALDKEEFTAYTLQFTPKEEQRAVTDKISSEFGLLPMEAPFDYVKELQSRFDYTQIPYTEDYFDPEMNSAAPEKEQKWEVRFSGGFWPSNKKERPGKKIATECRFVWGKESWSVPAVYCCAGGIVMDICAEIDSASVKAFFDKWMPLYLSGESPDEKQQKELEKDYPLSIEFSAELTVNGAKLYNSHGSALTFIPDTFIPRGTENQRETIRLIEYYGLDKTKAWSIHRLAFPWATSRKPQIRTLALKVSRDPETVFGIRFSVSKAGDSVKLTNPFTRTEHTLTVTEYEKRDFPQSTFAESGLEYPTHCTLMAYTLTPDIPPENFRIRDTRDSDQPRRGHKNSFAPDAEYDACIGIIGGADGPTALIVSENRLCAATSSLSFEPRNDIVWQTVFQAKTLPDKEIELI